MRPASLYIALNSVPVNKFAIFTANTALVANVKEQLCRPSVLVFPPPRCNSAGKHDKAVLPSNHWKVEARVAKTKRVLEKGFLSVF
jgi:hypothetical protein